MGAYPGHFGKYNCSPIDGISSAADTSMARTLHNACKEVRSSNTLIHMDHTLAALTTKVGKLTVLSVAGASFTLLAKVSIQWAWEFGNLNCEMFNVAIVTKLRMLLKFPATQIIIYYLNFLLLHGFQGNNENSTVSRQTLTANEGRYNSYEKNHQS